MDYTMNFIELWGRFDPLLQKSFKLAYRSGTYGDYIIQTKSFMDALSFYQEKSNAVKELIAPFRHIISRDDGEKNEEMTADVRTEKTLLSPCVYNSLKKLLDEKAGKIKAEDLLVNLVRKGKESQILVDINTAGYDRKFIEDRAKVVENLMKTVSRAHQAFVTFSSVVNFWNLIQTTDITRIISLVFFGVIFYYGKYLYSQSKYKIFLVEDPEKPVE